MIYMLDTDTVSMLVRKNPRIVQRLIQHEDDEVCISVLSYAELAYGLEKKGSPKLFDEVQTLVAKLSIIAFDESQAALYGKIRARLEKAGTLVGDMDMLIAAAALSCGAILVSHNTQHFSKISGLRLEDWCTAI